MQFNTLVIMALASVAVAHVNTSSGNYSSMSCTSCTSMAGTSTVVVPSSTITKVTQVPETTTTVLPSTKYNATSTYCPSVGGGNVTYGGGNLTATGAPPMATGGASNVFAPAVGAVVVAGVVALLF